MISNIHETKELGYKNIRMQKAEIKINLNIKTKIKNS